MNKQTTGRSWASVAQGPKRSIQSQLLSFTQKTKKGPYVPSEGWLKFVTTEKWYNDITRALPKSAIPHGIRVNFGGDPSTFIDAAATVQKTYPNAVAVQQGPLKDFFDLGFETKEEADEAATLTLRAKVTSPNGKTQEVIIPTTRTRYNLDESLFISFDGLPMDMKREKVKKSLLEGLEKYGEIVQFELLKNPYMPHLTTSKAMAMIKPNKKTLANLNCIPRRAYVRKDNGETSVEFRVFPKKTPPMCAKCNALGHREALCPTTVEGIQAADMAEKAQQGPDGQVDASIAMEWGSQAEYCVVKPRRSEPKKKAKPTADSAAQGPSVPTTKPIPGTQPTPELQEVQIVVQEPQYAIGTQQDAAHHAPQEPGPQPGSLILDEPMIALDNNEEGSQSMNTRSRRTSRVTRQQVQPYSKSETGGTRPNRPQAEKAAHALVESPEEEAHRA